MDRKSPANFDRIQSTSVVFKINYGLSEEDNSADKVESYDITNDTWTIEKSLYKEENKHPAGYLEIFFLLLEKMWMELFLTL